MKNELKTLREQIDEIDNEILILFAKRNSIVKKIKDYKREHDLPARDEKRWQQVKDTWRKKAHQLDLTEDLVERIYNLIHEHAVALQKKK